MHTKLTAALLCAACLFSFTACGAPAASLPESAAPTASSSELPDLPDLTRQDVQTALETPDTETLATLPAYEEVWAEDTIRPHLWVGSRLYTFEGYLTSCKLAKLDGYDPTLSEWVWDGESTYLDWPLTVITSGSWPLACGVAAGMPQSEALSLLSGYSQYAKNGLIDLTAQNGNEVEALQWGQFYPGLFSGYTAALALPFESSGTTTHYLCLYFDEAETLSAITYTETGRWPPV